MRDVFYHLENEVTREICGHYGSSLQDLSSAQKLELIGYLGLWGDRVLVAEDEDEDIHWGDRPVDGEPDDDVHVILDRCAELNLNISDIPALIMAIADTITI